MQANKKENMGHIDFIIPANDPSEKQRQYSQFILPGMHIMRNRVAWYASDQCFNGDFFSTKSKKLE
jgi:hypothetical protein